MQAFHGSSELKALMVAGVQAHYELDQIEQHTYGDFVDTSDTTQFPTGVKFKGCAVGCTLRTVELLQGKTDIIAHAHAGAWDDLESYGDFDLYERYLGVPYKLAEIEESLFEAHIFTDPAYDTAKATIEDERRRWPVDFIEAIPVGADLSQIKVQYREQFGEGAEYSWDMSIEQWRERRAWLLNALRTAPVPEVITPDETEETTFATDLIAAIVREQEQPVPTPAY